MAAVMLFRSFVLLGCGFTVWVMTASAAGAIELYRYRDNRGGIVIDRNGVPPEYINRGYEVLNEQAVVIRVVPPAPSLEEYQRRLAQQQRARQDQQLMRLYTSVTDVEQARDRKLAELDGLIGVVQANKTSLLAMQERLQKQADESLQSGREMPEHVAERLQSLKQQQTSLDQTIERYRLVRREAEITYAADRARVAELLGH